jgi:hypothetical protein
VSVEVGLFATLAVAFLGAAAVLAMQRTICPASR